MEKGSDRKGEGREGQRRGREEGKRREGGNEGVHLMHFAFRTLAALS